MNVKTLVAGLLVAGCVSAAAGGGYLAMRQDQAAAQPAVPLTPAVAVPAIESVTETEEVVGVEKVDGVAEPATPPPASIAPPRSRQRDARSSNASPVGRADPARNTGRSSVPSVANVRTENETPAAAPVPTIAEPSEPDPAVAAVAVEPELAPMLEPQYDEVILPAASVVGLQIETTVSSERARVEDRVDARVTRDVSAAGRLAIPAGSRVIGSVTLVERGGKVKETARLGVRFHTLVLADGREIPLRTEAILREGDSPGAESARKIGGAAIGGAILGALMGGKKGAVLGGAAGAAGGTAAVVNGGRNAATLPSGTVVTVKLASPATIDVERN